MDRIVLSVAMLAIAKEFGFSLAEQVGSSATRCMAVMLLEAVHVGVQPAVVNHQWMRSVCVQGIISSAFLWGYIGKPPCLSNGLCSQMCR